MTHSYVPTQDFISLTAQGAGGGLAGSADGDQSQLNLVCSIPSFLLAAADRTQGSHIMLGGIVFQLGTSNQHVSSAVTDLYITVPASITVFVMLMIEYFIRYANNWPVRNPKAVAERSTMVSIRGKMSTRMQLMVLGVCLNTLFLFIRCVHVLRFVGFAEQQPLW